MFWTYFEPGGHSEAPEPIQRSQKLFAGHLEVIPTVKKHFFRGPKLLLPYKAALETLFPIKF